jgi:hypothetical protein
MAINDRSVSWTQKYVLCHALGFVCDTTFIDCGQSSTHTAPLHVMKSLKKSQLRHSVTKHHIKAIHGYWSGVGVSIADLSGAGVCLELG